MHGLANTMLVVLTNDGVDILADLNMNLFAGINTDPKFPVPGPAEDLLF